MTTTDLLIVGAGPAGSSCAWALRAAGLDVVVIDKSSFPRDKTCAGWITPPVIDALDIDIDTYRQKRTFQPITAFRVGVIGSDRTVDVLYERPVSFGIRRCEFDNYLLQRCAARLQLGSAVSSIRRSGGLWIVDERIAAPMIVGAGGHFCPVARFVNGVPHPASTIAAQEAEFRIAPSDWDAYVVAPERPEIFFCPDLGGYGWCFRKEEYINIGFGRINAHGLPAMRDDFVAFLRRRRAIPTAGCWRWHGHAYLIAGQPRRRIDDGVLLVGDAAGLAHPSSGEGIRPAIESGLIAATTILDAAGQYDSNRLAAYERQIRRRFDSGLASRAIQYIPRTITAALGRQLLQMPSVAPSLLDRWFLQAV